MKQPHQQSIDGFIPRRRQPQTPPQHNGLRQPGAQQPSHSSLSPHTEQQGLRRSELDASLASLDEPKPAEQSKKRRFRINKKIAKRIAIVLAIILLAVGIYIGIKAVLASANVFQGNILGIVQNKPLKEDENGRSNIVLFGTSEDDEGGDHPGAYLTDSIMVVSLNQTKKDAYMVSIPRDLWVDYGVGCNAGYEGKVNELYTCHSESGTNEAAGSDALRAKIGEVTGLDVQYYAHVNYSVVRDAVDAVGGVEVTIDSEDPRGILDRNFDWKCEYQCHYVKYENGPTGVMDGEHALALARARGSSAPTYGLEGGNFDREQYQQKILTALKDKAVSAGTATNVGKVTSLMDAFGENLRTNFETSEVRTLMSLAQDIQTDKINSLSLVDGDDPVVTTGDVGGQSIVRPVSGLYDYASIAAFLQKELNSDAATRENAAIGVYNGSGEAGVAQQVADEITAKGFSVDAVGNAPDGEYDSYELYIVDDTKKATKERFEKMYGVTAKTTQPPVDAAGLDVILVVGRAPSN